MKTPQEVFKLMLEHWDEFITSDDCICIRLISMSLWKHDKISFQEADLAKKFMWVYREVAVSEFKATKEGYWWPEYNQEVRKQFVKYLSEQL